MPKLARFTRYRNQRAEFFSNPFARRRQPTLGERIGSAAGTALKGAALLGAGAAAVRYGGAGLRGASKGLAAATAGGAKLGLGGTASAIAKGAGRGVGRRLGGDLTRAGGAIAGSEGTGIRGAVGGQIRSAGIGLAGMTRTGKGVASRAKSASTGVAPNPQTPKVADPLSSNTSSPAKLSSRQRRENRNKALSYSENNGKVATDRGKIGQLNDVNKRYYAAKKAGSKGISMDSLTKERRRLLMEVKKPVWELRQKKPAIYSSSMMSLASFNRKYS